MFTFWKTSVIAVLLVFLGFFAFLRPAEVPTSIPPSPSISIAIRGVLESETVSIAENTSALAQLRDYATSRNIEVQTKEFPGMGTLVEKIGPFSNGDGGKYWHFYVNNALAPVGASDYILKDTDIVDWKFIEPDTAY